MMASVNDEAPSDESWLISQAKTCLSKNIYEARAWLLVARTLFPRNFVFQYEAYQIEKSKKNVKEVAKLIDDMLRSFPGEPQLWAEIQIMTDALQSESTAAKDLFLKDCFGALPSAIQCHILLRITETTPDVLQQCKLMLLILTRHPEQVAEHGVKLIESLLIAEKQMQLLSPVNCYRKYLVCDVLPLVVASPIPKFGHKHLYRWLQKAIEFYVCYVTQPLSSEATHSSTTPELMSPTLKGSLAGNRRLSITGLTSSESLIVEPWKQLFHLVKLIGEHLGWQIGDLFDKAGSSSTEKKWQCLQHMNEALCNHTDPSLHAKQLLYCTMLVMFHHVYHHTVRTIPHLITGSSSSQQLPLVMIESLRHGKPDLSEHKHKKVKVESGSGGNSRDVECSEAVLEPGEVIHNFQMAVKCWELIHTTETVEKEFNKLCQYWKAHTWSWLNNFEVDYLIYQGHFKEASAKLRTNSSAPRNHQLAVKSDIQLACCYFCLGYYPRACELALALVSSLVPGGTAPKPCEGDWKAHQLQLLVCNEAEVLPYCIQLMIICFQEKAFKFAMPNDMALGHMLVLMQYNWSYYEDLFAEVVDKISHQGSFTYNPFFNYIINIDILEEFAELRNQVNLDILSTSTKSLTQSRTVTRGVNKGVNEDFRAALEKQVACSNSSVNSLVKQFLMEEKDLLKQCLL